MLSRDERAALERTPGKRRPDLATRLRKAAGDVWNLPNDLIGAGYGGLGAVVGEIGHAVAPSQVSKPQIRRGADRTEYVNNPFAAAGAITIGRTIVYGDDPYSPEGRVAWGPREAQEGHPVWEREAQHITQGRQLGPFYLPSNLMGGLAGLAMDRDWHGPHNWNERGPQSNPPRPWAWKITR